MSLYSRVGNAFRGGLLNREIDEELESHLAKAIDAGRAPAEARQALGSLLAAREEIRDIKLLPWFDSLR
jgi:hypothetical protein